MNSMYREHFKKKKTKTDIKERVLAGADNTISERKKEIRDNKLYSNTISQEINHIRRNSKQFPQVKREDQMKRLNPK